MTAVQHPPAEYRPSKSAGASGTLADVTERLMAEFEDRVDLAAISRVVNQARRDLHPLPDGPLAELVERLARQRLLDQPAGPSAVPVPRGR